MKLQHTRHFTVSSMVPNAHVPDVVFREDAEPANTGRGEETSSSDLEGVSRVIYIGQLPHGFYEEQLKGAAFARIAITVPYAAATWFVSSLVKPDLFVLEAQAGVHHCRIL